MPDQRAGHRDASNCALFRASRPANSAFWWHAATANGWRSNVNATATIAASQSAALLRLFLIFQSTYYFVPVQQGMLEEQK